MSTKSQTVFAICFGLFLAVVVTVSLLFADRLGRKGGLGTNGKLGCLGIDLVDKLFHLIFPFMFEIIWFTVNRYLPKKNRLHFSRVLP